MTKRTLNSWGKYPYSTQTSHQVFWQQEIPTVAKNIVQRFGNTLAFGNGRSYGDSCLALSNQVIHTKTLNKFISADWERGVIVAEAGVTLADIIELSLPKGWFVPVTPGTKYVTLGGAIANDVHGKNHHIRGTFSGYVPSFGLWRSNGEHYHCSVLENRDLYQATIGGLGLTGVITWVELRLIPITSNQIDSITVRFANLTEFFALCEQYDQEYEYSVAWIDCLANSQSLGRGVFFAGNHADQGELICHLQKKIKIPFTLPCSSINYFSLLAFNNFYYHKHPKKMSLSKMYYEPFFYPLDGILEWNRIYGRKGFQQYQCVIPINNAQKVITEVLFQISKHKIGSFLAVLKKCGDISSMGWLSFPVVGVSLALDFPQQLSNNILFDALDTVVSEAGGRLYPAKDAHMSAVHFKKAYPLWEKMESIRDPILMSAFWKRVIEE